MVRVRCKLTPLFKNIIGSATSTIYLLPSTSIMQQIVVDTITGLTAMKAPDALESLSETVFRAAETQNEGTARIASAQNRARTS